MSYLQTPIKLENKEMKNKNLITVQVNLNRDRTQSLIEML